MTVLSVAEVILYDANGEAVPGVEAYNPGGQAGNPFEEPTAAVDGDVTTKWLDTQFYSEAVLQLLLAQPTQVVQYELITSTGASTSNVNRDPTSWSFGIRRAIVEEGKRGLQLASARQRP